MLKLLVECVLDVDDESVTKRIAREHQTVIRISYGKAIGLEAWYHTRIKGYCSAFEVGRITSSELVLVVHGGDISGKILLERRVLQQQMLVWFCTNPKEKKSRKPIRTSTKCIWLL